MTQDLRYTVDADDGPLKQAMRRVQDQFKETHEGAKNMVAGLQGSFGTLNKLIGGVTAALAGGAGIKASIEATQLFTGESLKLARVLGTTATEASGLNVALGDIYTDADVFTAAAGKLAKELRTNESALQAMGLRTRDASGALRPLNELMLDSIQVVNSYKQGVDRNIAAQMVWGKSADEAAQLLKLNNQVLDEAREKQQQLGLTVGVENVASYQAYRAAMNDAGDVMLGIKKAVGDAIIPVLTQLGTWFSDIGPAAITVIKGAVGGLVSVFWGLRAAVVIVWETINAMVITVTEPLRALGAAFVKMLSGDMEGAAKEFRNIPTTIQHAWNNALISIGDTAEETRNRVAALFSTPTAIAAKPAQGKSAAGLLKPEAETSQMSQWQGELAALKQAHAETNAANGTFYEFSLDAERAFWEKKQQSVAKGTKDWAGAQVKITALVLDHQKDLFEERLAMLKREDAAAEQNFSARETLAQREISLVKERFGAESKQAQDAQRKLEDLQRQAREQRRALREAEIQETQATGLQVVELERQKLQLMADAGLITREQLLAGELQFEQQRYQIQMQALSQRQQLIDPTLNPVEYARIKNEILELERQHQLQMGEIRNAATLQDNARVLDTVRNMETGWASAIKGMLTGTQTLGQGIRNIFKSAAMAVADAIAQMAAKWMAQQLLMKLFGKAMTVGAISEKAAEAGAGGVASMGAAPWPLNMTAPIFGAAMAGAAMAFAPMASAAQGWDIPAGINPLVQAHAREMILPEKQADVIRAMADDGSGGRGGDTFVIHAVDARSFQQLLQDNPAALSAGLQNAKRRGF